MITKGHATREWVDTGLSGIQTCTTCAESGGGSYVTRLNAGARFPRHTHRGWEQNFVVSGRVLFNEIELQAGDTLQAQGADAHEAMALEESVPFTGHHGGIFSDA